MGQNNNQHRQPPPPPTSQPALDPLEAARVGGGQRQMAAPQGPPPSPPALPQAVPPKPPLVAPVHVDRYRVTADKLVSTGAGATWVRRGDVVSDETGPGWVARLRDQHVEMEPLQ